MNATRMKVILGGLICAQIAASGCVSRDEYLREMFARRKAAERADALERDLADERNRSMALEKEREGLQRELDTKTALAETLRGENDRLAALNAKLQSQMDDVLARGMGDVKVVEVKLPPELDKALQEFAAQYPDQVEYDSKRGAVRWKSDLTFALGSDEVRDTIRSALKAFSDIVNSSAARGFEVVICGHTDNVPIRSAASKHPTNWHLSVHRSVAVAFLLNQYGVDFHRVGVMGYGEYRPRVPNPARGGSETNRRVEIFLVSAKDDSFGLDTTAQGATDDAGIGETPDGQ